MKVDAIDEHGEAAALARIHEAGLFAGPRRIGSKRYSCGPVRRDVVDLDDPYRFPPVLTDFDLYLLGEGTHQRIYDKARRAYRLCWMASNGVAFVVLAPNAQRVSVVERLQFLECKATPMRRARPRLLGFSYPTPPRTTAINSISSARRATICR